MKKILISLICLLIVFPFFFSKKVMAASLQVTGLGTVNVTGLNLGSSLKTYTYSGGTFALSGLASPSATISVHINSTTQTAIADAEGGWSTLVSSLTEGQHQFSLTSGSEALDFILTIGEASTASGESTTSGVSTTATTSSTLPTAGSPLTSILFLALAMLSVGLGLTFRAKQS